MYIPKKYGQSKIDKCPFCQRQATSVNSQKVPVCALHKNENLGELRCACGQALEMRTGKFGVFFTCLSCGSMNLKKVLEINTIEPKNKFSETKPRKETTVRSDDPRYF